MKVTLHLRAYSDTALSSGAYVDPSTFDHVSALLSGRWRDLQQADPVYFGRALVDLALFCDLFCIRDDVCFYAPNVGEAQPRFFRSAVTALENGFVGAFADGVKLIDFMTIDDEQRARIFHRWSDLAVSDYARGRPGGLPLEEPATQAILLGLFAEEMLGSSVYVPGADACEAYFQVAPDEIEFRTHNLLMKALGQINSAFLQTVQTRSALSSQAEPMIPPILAMILGTVSRPEEIAEELCRWRRKFKPLRRRFAELADTRRSDVPYATWRKRYARVQTDIARFLAGFELKDEWSSDAGVNPWDIPQVNQKHSADEWSTDFSLKLSSAVKLGADVLLGAVRRRRMRPLPRLASRVGRLSSLNSELQRVFGKTWTAQESAAFRPLIEAQAREWKRRANLSVSEVTASKPSVPKVFPPSDLKLDSLVDEFLCRLSAGHSRLERAEALLDVGLIALEDGAFRRGEFYVRSALEKVPKASRGGWRSLEARATAALARICARYRGPEEAEELFARAMARDSNGWVLNEYAAFLASREAPKALRVARRAVAADPNQQSAWINLASLLWGAGETEEAVECARRATSVGGPVTAEAFRQLGGMLASREDYSGAAVALAEAAKLLPRSSEIWASLASALGAAGDAVAAANAASQANEIDPSRLRDAQWRELSAFWSQSAGDHREAERLLRPIIRSKAATSATLRIYALALADMSDLPAARRALRKAHRLEPSDPESLESLYELEKRAAEPQAALRIARTLVRLFPERASAHAREGDALIAVGRLSEALSSYTRATERGFRQPRKFYDLAVNAESQGELLTAISFHILELSTSGDYAPAYANMAADYAETGDLEEAVKSAKRAIDLQPKDPINIHIMANVHLMRDEYAEAATLLSQLLELEATPPTILEVARSNLAAIDGYLRRAVDGDSSDLSSSAG